MCHQTVMLTFSVVCCLLKKGLLKGGHSLILVCRDKLLISGCEACTGK